MRNVFLKAIMSVALVSLLALGSCAKQRNVTDDLEQRLGKLEAKVDGLKAKLDAGLLITSVKPEGNKVVVTLSDGKPYEFMGYDAAVATVWTIDKDGNWLKNGEKTGWKAVKENAEKSEGEKEDEKEVKNGEPGLNGKYYVPNEDGFWYVVEWEVNKDGKQVEKAPVKTNKRWKPAEEEKAKAITAVYDNNILTISGAKGADGDIQIALVTLNNLFILPDNVGATSKHPLIVLRPFTIGKQTYDPGADPDVCPVGDKCDAIKLEGETWVRYRVSPASVTEAMIDMENIRFEAHQSNLRSNDGFTVKEAVLKNGILSVLVGYDLKEVDKLNSWGLIEDVPTAGTSQGQMIEQLMLVVPTKSGNEKEVYSDWAQVVQQPAKFEDYKGYTATSILLNQYYNRPLKKLYNSVAGAKAGDAIASIPYGTPTELKKLVGLYDKDNKLKLYLAEYDLEFQFDLLDEEGKPFEYKVPADNNTDQQKFVTIKDGIITPQSLAGKELDQSSTGRTPIVRVTVHYKGENYACNPLSTYFIKLEITKKKTSESKTVAYKFEKPITNICKNYVGDDALVFNTTEVNKKILEDLGLTAAEFQKEFVFDGYANEKTKTRNPLVVGTVTTDPATSAPQGTVNVFWSITAGEITPIHYGKTITKTAIYRSKTGTQEISIVLSVDVTEPIIKAADILNPTWYSKLEDKSNPVVEVYPGIPGSNPTEAVFPENVIYNAFKNDQKTPVPNIVFPESLGEFTYEFVFARHQKFEGIKEPITEGANKGKTRTVEVFVDKAALNKLQALEKIDGVAQGNAVTIAILQPNGKIVTNFDSKNLAKELINHGAKFMKAKVELKVYSKCLKGKKYEDGTPINAAVKVTGFGGPCGDQLTLVWRRPINHQPKVLSHKFYAEASSDAVQNYLHVGDLLQLTSHNGDTFKVQDYANSGIANPVNSFKYWGVKKITVDLDNATTIPENVGGDFKLSWAEKANWNYQYALDTVDNPAFDDKKKEGPTNIKKLPGEIYKTYATTLADPNKPFIWFTPSKVKASDFQIVIPVTIEYTYGTIKSTVTIPVSGGNVPANN